MPNKFSFEQGLGLILFNYIKNLTSSNLHR